MCKVMVPQLMPQRFFSFSKLHAKNEKEMFSIQLHNCVVFMIMVEHRVRLSKVVADHDDLQTQSRCIHCPFQWTEIKKGEKPKKK